MSNLVECPNCLGSGEEVYKKNYVKTCKYCKGDGMVNEEISESLLNQHLF
jgi:DnaJ-class molecular chaperone